MFSVAWFMMAKNWKQPKCLTIEKLVKVQYVNYNKFY